MAMAEGRADTPIELIKLTEGYFREKGIDAPRLEAEVLLAHQLGVGRLDLYLNHDKPLSAAEIDGYRALVRRRARREPTAYLLGRREFWSLALDVGPGVLIPRPDTEVLVEAALARMGETGRFFEPCLGTAAVSLALLTEKPGWTGVGVEQSPEATRYAEINRNRLGLADRLVIRRGDLFAPVAGDRFDLIVVNPPYIPTGELAALMAEVRDFEPPEALDGGPDGLDLVRRLLAGAADHLTPGGALLMEVGAGQAPTVTRLARETGDYEDVATRADYAGVERVVIGVL